MAGTVTRSIADRLWEKADVRTAGECWPWRASRDGRGRYGVFYRNGRLIGAHVAAYELVHGPVPEGLDVDHQCGNPACVNPAHLQVLTHRANTLRGTAPSAVNHRKTQCKNGHHFTRVNTRVDKRGARICRTCDNANDRQRHRAARGATT